MPPLATPTKSIKGQSNTPNGRVALKRGMARSRADNY